MDGLDVAGEGMRVGGDSDGLTFAPDEERGRPSEAGGRGEEVVAIGTSEAEYLWEGGLRCTKDDDDAAALKEAGRLVAAAVEDIGDRDGVALRRAVDDMEVGVGAVGATALGGLADGVEDACGVDGDGLEVGEGGGVEDGVVIDGGVGEGADDGEDAHGGLASCT